MEPLSKSQFIEIIKRSIEQYTVDGYEDPVEKAAGMIADEFIELREERDFLVGATKRLRQSLKLAESFRTEIENELIVCHIYCNEHDKNARKAVQDIIAWNVSVALDRRCNPEIESLHEQIDGLHGIIDFMLKNGNSNTR